MNIRIGELQFEEYDQTLTDEFLRKGEGAIPPPKKLLFAFMKAMLEETVKLAKIGEVGRKRLEENLGWFSDDIDSMADGGYRFVTVCSILDIHPETIRKLLREEIRCFINS